MMSRPKSLGGLTLSSGNPARHLPPPLPSARRPGPRSTGKPHLCARPSSHSRRFVATAAVFRTAWMACVPDPTARACARQIPASSTSESGSSSHQRSGDSTYLSVPLGQPHLRRGCYRPHRVLCHKGNDTTDPLVQVFYSG